MIYLRYLSPRWRILYLLFKNPEIDISDLEKEFSIEDQERMHQIVMTLGLEGIIHFSVEIPYFTIINIENDPFLKVISFFYKNVKPLTRTEIRGIIKHKFLNQIIDELLRSQIIYEYRTELSKKNYLVLTEKKAEMMELSNQNMMNGLKDSNNTYDQCHYSMLQNNQSILRYSDTSTNFSDINKDETKLLVNLYNDVAVKKSRKVGRNEEFIIQEIFDGNEKKAKKSIIGLIKKKFIRCSYKHYYYLNNCIINEVKPFFEANKKMVINPPDELKGTQS